MTLHLAEPLVVRSVTSREFGRLLHLRVVGQNSILISLPGRRPRGHGARADHRLWRAAAHRRASIARPRPFSKAARRSSARTSSCPLEAHFVYSNRSYWYPQATGHRLRDGACSRSSCRRSSTPSPAGRHRAGRTLADPLTPGQRPRKQYVFDTTQPARYLACVISRFHGLDADAARPAVSSEQPGTSGRPVPIA